MIALIDGPARRFLLGLGKTLPRPKAIVVVSAHWEPVGDVDVSLAPGPETIHDVGGCSPAFFEIQHPAPGAPDTAARVADALHTAGFPVRRGASRGLDHGAWVALSLMYPNADIPTTQLSIKHGGSPADHERMGQALRALRDDDVLIIGSGSLAHNLFAFRGAAIDADVSQWVSAFDHWAYTHITTGQRKSLLEYRALAPFAVSDHPSEEHLLPLFVAIEATGEAPTATRPHASCQYGVLAIDADAFS
jgi:4,5-DOPA dioxygenase extradiol